MQLSAPSPKARALSQEYNLTESYKPWLISRKCSWAKTYLSQGQFGFPTAMHLDVNGVGNPSNKGYLAEPSKSYFHSTVTSNNSSWRATILHLYLMSLVRICFSFLLACEIMYMHMIHLHHSSVCLVKSFNTEIGPISHPRPISNIAVATVIKRTSRRRSGGCKFISNSASSTSYQRLTFRF